MFTWSGQRARYDSQGITLCIEAPTGPSQATWSAGSPSTGGPPGCTRIWVDGVATR
ncbi:hypothetical protein FRAAL4894 [Frankia alni ACN14a]|uniref:Uncharacterized protein n=1 Tax=Frankia alni (strain DSM 45986 / CECT 9034 / ACN14a) TaxID=326424 RepID=Q0RG54_FRAAA|nr:hypothetical protein FRAAL4894 [Frankia alni ACN14a]